MKYKTLKNMERATRLIAAKGYDWNTANDIAIRLFDDSKQLNNGMSIEWFIDKIVSKEEHERDSRNELHDIREISR